MRKWNLLAWAFPNTSKSYLRCWQQDGSRILNTSSSRSSSLPRRIGMNYHPDILRTITTTTTTTTTATTRSTWNIVPCSSSSSSSLYCLSTTRLYSSSSFEAPEPPSCQGEAIFPDIDFSVGSSSSSSSSSMDSESNKRNVDPNAIFVVTGASRGIGLQFVKSLHQRTKGIIIAACRSPSTAIGLTQFVNSLSSEQQQQQQQQQASSSRIVIMTLDLESQDSIESFAKEIQSSYGRVDGLLNVAGVLGDGTPGPERSLRQIDRTWLEHTMAINLIAPLMLSQSLAPLMKLPRQRKRPTTNNNNDDNSVRAKSVIVNLSARVGSISDNGLGGWYSYRISKSALNQATRTMAHELKRQGTWTVALHPGTTDTDLSKPFQRNVQEGRLFPVEFTVQQLLNVIDSLTDSHTGGFYDWAGKALPF